MSRVLGDPVGQAAGRIGEEGQVERGPLGPVAPELGEWATFFAAGAAKRAAAEAGLSSAVTEREADDLVREVGAFLAVVENYLAATAPEPPRSPFRRPRPAGG